MRDQGLGHADKSQNFSNCSTTSADETACTQQPRLRPGCCLNAVSFLDEYGIVTALEQMALSCLWLHMSSDPQCLAGWTTPHSPVFKHASRFVWDSSSLRDPHMMHGHRGMMSDQGMGLRIGNIGGDVASPICGGPPHLGLGMWLSVQHSCVRQRSEKWPFRGHPVT